MGSNSICTCSFTRSRSETWSCSSGRRRPRQKRPRRGARGQGRHRHGPAPEGDQRAVRGKDFAQTLGLASPARLLRQALLRRRRLLPHDATRWVRTYSFRIAGDLQARPASQSTRECSASTAAEQRRSGLEEDLQQLAPPRRSRSIACALDHSGDRAYGISLQRDSGGHHPRARAGRGFRAPRTCAPRRPRRATESVPPRRTRKRSANMMGTSWFVWAGWINGE